MTYLRKVKGENSNLYTHLYGYNHQVTLLGWESRSHNTENDYNCALRQNPTSTLEGKQRQKTYRSRKGWDLDERFLGIG